MYGLDQPLGSPFGSPCPKRPNDGSLDQSKFLLRDLGNVSTKRQPGNSLRANQHFSDMKRHGKGSNVLDLSQDTFEGPWVKVESTPIAGVHLCTKNLKFKLNRV